LRKTQKTVHYRTQNQTVTGTFP